MPTGIPTTKINKARIAPTILALGRLGEGGVITGGIVNEAGGGEVGSAGGMVGEVCSSVCAGGGITGKSLITGWGNSVGDSGITGGGLTGPFAGGVSVGIIPGPMVGVWFGWAVLSGM